MPSFTLVFGETASSPTLISRFWRVALVHEQGSICGIPGPRGMPGTDAPRDRNPQQEITGGGEVNKREGEANKRRGIPYSGCIQ